MEKIRLGFLGGGVDSIAGGVHLIASEMDNKFKVIGGIFSKDEQKSKLSAKEYRVKHFNSIEEMIKSVDAIVILTPTPLHYENLLELRNYQIPLIVDKPLVSSLKEKLEFENNVIVTHNYSGYPLVREIKYLIKNGVLGDIKKIDIKMPQESFFKPMKKGYPQKWRLKDGEIPNIMLDLGVHTYHLLKFIYPKKIDEVFAECNKFSNHNVYDDCEILIKIDKVLCKMSFSKISIGNANSLSIEVFGDKAGVKWEQNESEKLLLSYFNGKKEILNRSNAYFEVNKERYQRMAYGHPSGFIEAFANLYSDIFDYLNGEKNDFVYDYHHSIDSLKFLDTAYKSYKEKRWMKL
jgi:predicted dehydrogenase